MTTAQPISTDIKNNLNVKSQSNKTYVAVQSWKNIKNLGPINNERINNLLNYSEPSKSTSKWRKEHITSNRTLDKWFDLERYIKSNGNKVGKSKYIFIQY